MCILQVHRVLLKAFVAIVSHTSDDGDVQVLRVEQLLVILVLHSPSTLTIPKATSALRTPLSSKVPTLLAPTALILAHTSANTEQHGADEEASESCPCESVAVDADFCGGTVRFEGIAADYCPGSANDND